MKKICFLIPTPFSYGGEQRVVTIVSNLLIKKGYDISILCTDMTYPINYDLYNLDRKVKIDYLDGYNNKYVLKFRVKRDQMNIENLNTGKYKNSLLMQKFINCDLIITYLLIRKITKEKYDCVISLGIMNKLLARVSKHVKAKTIAWQHSSSERYFNLKGEWFYNQEKYCKYMFKKVDDYVVLTNKDKQYIKEKFNVEVSVINNPKSILSNKVTNLKNKYFLAVGRFVPVKNFEILIDMFNGFHAMNKKWHLRIVGSGELKETYLKKIKKYKLEKYIEIIDYTVDIEKYYLSSSIYLMTSLQEGWGMVMGEAIEFGLPIISFDITSASEMIKDYFNGYIIEKYDQNKYIERMLELANDEKKLKRFSKNSKKLSNKKSNDKIIDKWIKKLEK